MSAAFTPSLYFLIRDEHLQRIAVQGFVQIRTSHLQINFTLRY